MSKLDLNIILQDFDDRGSIFRGDIRKKERFLIIEIKKGKARGGHYHNIDTFHFVLLGDVKYYERHLTKKGAKKYNSKERRARFRAGEIIPTPAYVAHMVVAIEDSIIIEPSGQGKTTTPYMEYRSLAQRY